MNSRERGGYSSSNNSNRSSNMNSNRSSRSANPSAQGPAQTHNHAPIHGHLSPRDQEDLESFKMALKELTFNSRPIIEKLTAMAKERARTIPGLISRTILDNLVFNNIKLKSCFLFLIDSICKNVGDPYPTSFVKHGLVSAYIRVYGEVWASGDEMQKKDFFRVLPTWNGLIAPEALREIEIKLGLPLSEPKPVISHPSIPHAPVTRYTPATMKLLVDLLSVFENPPGLRISGIVGEIFKRLSRSPDFPREVLNELDFKAKMSDKNQIIFTLKQLIDEAKSSSKMASPVKQKVPRDDAIKADNVANFDSEKVKTNEESPVPLAFELPPNFQIDLSLLSSIVEMNKLNTIGSLGESKEAFSLPSEDAHFCEIDLNSAELIKKRHNLYKVLYDDLALQCKTCAIRFRDTPEGQKLMTDHLDSHFRRNMRLKEKSKRVMARDWFGTESDWITAKRDSESTAEKAVNVFEESTDAITKNEDLNVFVEANEDEQGDQVRCDVCQESVELVWNDDREQWIYPGCLRSESNNRIIHASCNHKQLPSAAGEVESLLSPSKSKRTKTK